ncbi:YchJ family metal-binding protein [Roseateles noduli]|jgi:SEC-C motif-containing protein|uniref:YchJ family protein n=1 Tax=Roseateles noduli TaxID=2052484 RepID=UPI003D661C13
MKTEKSKTAANTAGRNSRAGSEVAPCACGSKLPYASCCGALHRAFAESGALIAADAQALMRSRYTAYTMDLIEYLLATWHPSTRPASLERGEQDLKWLGLEVRQHTRQDADHETVAFIARSKVGGRAHRMHEVSRFVREHGAWLYVDGQID